MSTHVPSYLYVIIDFTAPLVNLPYERHIALGQHNDNFVCCPDDALTWEARKFLIVQEIIQNDPDVICLQVHRFSLILRRLKIVI